MIGISGPGAAFDAVEHWVAVGEESSDSFDPSERGLDSHDFSLADCDIEVADALPPCVHFGTLIRCR